ncbi:MAG: fibronectin type III domain-containing protein [Mogibacterium sp.]|nr:fibronectin type III domain-containing protein [Mogibacterium sp.]
MNYKKRITALLLALMMILTMMPAMAFADDENNASDAAILDVTNEEAAVEESPADEPVTVQDETSGEAAPIDEEVIDDADADVSGEGLEEVSFGDDIEPSTLEDADAEELMEEFFLSDTPAEEELVPMTPKSVKGDRLTGNSLKFYNYFKSIVNKVYAANTTSASMVTTKKVKLSTILGKRTFTAKELGVSRIGYKKGGKWYVDDEAKKKINALISASDWETAWPKLYTSLLSDLSGKSYWVDWYSESNPNGKHYQFIVWDCPFNYDSTKLTFLASDTITFRLPVIKEFRYNSKAFYASTSKIKSATTAKNKAKSIVTAFDNVVKDFYSYDFTPEQVDCIRMLNYCEKIAELNTYDHEAADYNSSNKGGPWSMIPVFDNDPNTNAVCSGYARAFKYLCDLSTFNSDWIDCQIVSGDASGAHMWNTVRMHDGKNYLVDPTWIDRDSTDIVDLEWFLRGATQGDAKSFTISCNYNGNNYEYSREYDDWVVKTFAPEERRLSDRSYYDWLNEAIAVVPITLKKPVLKAPARGKGSFTAKWYKVSAFNALYVDGYQIQYSTKSSMSGAKKVTVKGYARMSRTIKKLKRNKNYYFRVRSYAKLGKKTYYSPWSAKRKVKTK